MPSVITIGSATRDVFLQSKNFKIVKDAHFTAKAGFPSGKAECLPLGSKIDVEKIIITTGGGATNTAVTFARQGIKTKSLIQVGNDTIGKEVVDDLKREGVSPMVIKDKSEPTGYSTLLLTPDGSRTILVYRGASSGLNEREVPFSKLTADWSYIIPGNVEFKTIRRILGACRGNGTHIACTPSKHYLKMGLDTLRPLLRKMRVVIMNREEAAMLTGIHYQKEEEIFKCLDGHIDGIAVMTDGPRGVVVSDGQYIFRAGIYKEKRVADRTGAGDAFGSGFVAGLIGGGDFSRKSIEEGIKLASANATSVVEHIGTKTGVLTKKQFLEQRRWKHFPIETTLL